MPSQSTRNAVPRGGSAIGPSHTARGVREGARSGQCCIHMRAHGGVANGVTPVDEALLKLVVHTLELRRRVRELCRPIEWAGERRRQPVVGDIRTDAPVGAVALAALIGVDD